MVVIYHEAGRGNDGVNAIVDSFKLEILEIMFITGSYEQDCRAIEHLEDFYIDISESIIIFIFSINLCITSTEEILSFPLFLKKKN